jgi:hypothetical protein
MFILKQHDNTKKKLAIKNYFKSSDVARATSSCVAIQNDINLAHLGTKFPYNIAVKTDKKINFPFILHTC